MSRSSAFLVVGVLRNHSSLDLPDQVVLEEVASQPLAERIAERFRTGGLLETYSEIRVESLKVEHSYRRVVKLVEEDVCEIRRRVAAGEYRKDIAREFGVSPSFVSQIVKGRAWADV